MWKLVFGRCFFGKLEVGFLGKQNCLERIKEINSDYNISFLEGAIENDVLCCEIKTKN